MTMMLVMGLKVFLHHLLFWISPALGFIFVWVTCYFSNLRSYKVALKSTCRLCGLSALSGLSGLLLKRLA